MVAKEHHRSMFGKLQTFGSFAAATFSRSMSSIATLREPHRQILSLIRCIGWFGLIIPKLRNITQIVRILPPPRAWIVAKP